MTAGGRWDEALDALAARLAEHRAVLGGAPAAPTYELPGDLGPFPPALLGRAQELLGELAELEAELGARLAVVAGRLLRRPDPVPVPIYLDARA
ncbi:MAG TPA: hypothetical protein VNF07_10125 [Acidimicrobiales bacterium]|nr:hypothetical protein [Acidimicrobiales bacterium]